MHLQFHHEVHGGLALVSLEQLYYVRVVQPIKYTDHRVAAAVNGL